MTSRRLIKLAYCRCLGPAAYGGMLRAQVVIPQLVIWIWSMRVWSEVTLGEYRHSWMALVHTSWFRVHTSSSILHTNGQVMQTSSHPKLFNGHPITVLTAGGCGCLSRRFHLHCVPGKRRLCLQGCHAQICHLSEIFLMNIGSIGYWNPAGF